jgi:hypothetical protein
MLEGWRASYYLEAFRIIGSKGREAGKEGAEAREGKERKEGFKL